MQNRLYTTFWSTRKLLKLGRTVLWKTSAIIYSIVCNDNLIRRGNIDATNIWFRRKVCLGIIWETNNSSPVSRKGIEGISPWPRPCLRVITGEGHCNQRIKTNTKANTKATMMLLVSAANLNIFTQPTANGELRQRFIFSSKIFTEHSSCHSTGKMAKRQQSAAMQVLLPGLGRLEAAATGAPPSITTLFSFYYHPHRDHQHQCHSFFKKHSWTIFKLFFLLLHVCPCVVYNLYCITIWTHCIIFWIFLNLQSVRDKPSWITCSKSLRGL